MAKSSGPAVLIAIAGLLVMGATTAVVFLAGSADSEVSSAPAVAVAPAPAPASVPPVVEPSHSEPVIVPAPKPAEPAEPATVTLESSVRPSPESSGTLDSGVIRRIMGQHQSRVRACYEDGLQRDPALAGRVEAKFVIATTGVVEESTIVSSTLGDDAVETCILGVLDALRFPAPEGGSVTVTYPFAFTAQ